jgi:hypothetical protein
MTARPVAQILVRFGSHEAPDESAAAQDDMCCLPLASETPAEDPALLIEAARDEGRVEGLAAAKAQHGAALAQEKLLFEGRLATERAGWTRQESERLAGKFAAALSELEAKIAASAARALRGFLIERLRGEAVAQLADDVRALLAGKARPVVEISGAPDLLAALRESLSGFADAIEFAPNQSPDVKAVADETIIETRIEAWIGRITALSE